MTTSAMDLFVEEMAKVSAKPEHEQRQAVRKAFDSLPQEQKDVISQALAIQKPDKETSNTIWLIVISCFGIVMVLSVLVLSLSVFKSPATDGAKPETILTVFMTVTAFLAGLFAPSPVPKKGNG